MKKNSHQFSIQTMAKVFGVSRSAYYASLSRGESFREKENRSLLEEIMEIHENSRKTYGSPRIHAELKARGKKTSRRRVATLMKKEGICAKMHKRKNKPRSKEKKKERIAPNILDQKFNVAKPNSVWASDITYIPTSEGWLYLTVVMDLFSRKVVGMSFRDNLEAETVIEAFDQAYLHRQPKGSFIHHSDRGAQYTSERFQNHLKEKGGTLSMSAKGYCYDNAVVESFFHTLKTEHANFCKYRSRREARRSLFEYIEIFYNKKRRHSSLGYLSPQEFEKKNKMNFFFLKPLMKKENPIRRKMSRSSFSSPKGNLDLFQRLDRLSKQWQREKFHKNFKE